jgi:hypothetical protein
MPSAPVIITPAFTPPSPSAPAVVKSAFSAGSPSAPAVVTGAFSAGSPTAPRVVTGSYTPPSPAGPASVTSSYTAGTPAVGAVLVVATDFFGTVTNHARLTVRAGGTAWNGRSLVLSSTADPSPTGPYASGAVTSVVVNSSGITVNWYPTQGGFTGAALVAGLQADATANATVLSEVITGTGNIGTATRTFSGGAEATITTPPSISADFSSGSPTAPRAITSAFSAGSPSAPPVIRSAYTPPSPSAPPAITT